MPLPVRKKRRRSMPCAFAAFVLMALSRLSYCFCCVVGCGGMNSSLDAMRLGIGNVSAPASNSHWRIHMASPPPRNDTV